MTFKQLSIVLVLVAALAAGVVGVQLSKNKESKEPSESRRGEKVFPGLALDKIASISVIKNDSKVSLTKTESGWAVSERGSYAANFPDIRDLLLDISNLKIVDTVNVSPERYDMFNLQDPTDENSVEKKSATVVELKGADGSDLATLFIGKEPLEDGAQSRQRGIDSKSIYARVKGNDEVLLLNKTAKAPQATPGGFPPMSSLSGWLSYAAEPSDWIDKEFFNVSNANMIDVIHPDPKESWKVVKTPGENGGEDQWDLVDLEPGMVLDIDSKASGIRYLLTNPSFREVVTPEEAEELDWSKDTIKATIATDDGFKYVLHMLKTDPEADSSDYYVKVETTAEIPEERPAVEGESETEKLRKDAEFAASLPRLKEKIEKERGFNDWVFEISEYNLSALLKKRSEIIKEEEKEEPEAPGSTDKPDAPAKPDTPNTSDKPDEPAKPDTPDSTDKPDAPAKPDTPDPSDKPDTPAKPDTPDPSDKPDKPAKPDTPDSTDKPDEPAKPDTPDSTDKPDEPAKPDTPEPSEKPDAPAKPEESDAATDPEKAPKPDVQEDAKASDDPPAPVDSVDPADSTPSDVTGEPDSTPPSTTEDTKPDEPADGDNS